MNKLRESARGEECTFQIFPHCNQNNETVVLCHISCEDKGMGIKSPDWWSGYGCSDCHDIIDHRRITNLPESAIIQAIMRGVYRTHKRLIEKGLMQV